MCPSDTAERGAPDDLSTSLTPGAGGVVELPAGSVDALEAAIIAAGRHGTVIVKSGLHTESGTVTIGFPVTILGEPGAVLEVDTCPDPAVPMEVEAALHVFGARHVAIRGLEIRATPTHQGPCAGQLDGIGSAAILVEDSSHATISGNFIHQHQFGVLLDHGDHASISDNVIQGVSPAIFFNFGILVLNGEHVRIVSNDVSGAAAGIFTGDVGGKALFNNCHGNGFGVVL